MKLNKFILSVLTLLFCFTLFSCQDSTGGNDDNGDNPDEKTELKFKSAVLVSIEGTSDLSIKASISGELGTIYAVLSKEDNSPSASSIEEGKDFVWSGNGKTIDETITNLDPGKPYYAFFVIKHENEYSSVVRKTATTIEPDVDKGEGTKENPFKVSTIEDLEHVGAGPYDTYNLDWNADNTYYRLENDIDLSSKYGENKANWTPIKIGREAEFDGAGHTISGVYIHTTSTTNLGLFEGINILGVVKNLKVTNIRITSNGYNDVPRKFDASLEGEKQYTSTNVSGVTAEGIYVGGLTGDCKGSIENVVVSDAIIKVSGGRVGGLTGRIYGDEGTAVKVNNVSVEATVEGVSRVGGVVGIIDAKSKATFETPVITNVTFKGTVKGITTMLTEDSFSAGEYIGGFAGYARAVDASNIVVDGTIDGLRHVGGVVGFLQKNNNVTNPSLIKNTLFKGTTIVELGTNAGPLVGNRSTSNATEENCVITGFYLSTSKFMKKDAELPFDTLASTAKWGEVVEELSEDWYKTNLPSFDLETIFTLDEAFFPKLR